MVILNKHNYHRASKVRPVGSSTEASWVWVVDVKSDNYGNTESKAINDTTGEETIVCNYDRHLNNWEVIEWVYERNFEDLYDIAREAFYATSFSPESRALQYIRGYEAEVNADMAKMPEAMRDTYFEQFRSKIISLFAKHSRIMSSAITGAARFPVEKNRKANDAYDKAEQEFQAWRKSQLERAAKLIEDAKPQEERDNATWLNIKKEIDRSAILIFKIDTHKALGTDRALIVANLYGKLATLSKNVSVELFAKVMEYIKELGNTFIANGGKPIFTQRHKVWKLAEVAEVRRNKEAELAEKEDAEITFEGGSIVKCYSENRLQIFYDEKPCRDKIDALKNHGFRWSPSNGCWQRQLTNASYLAAAYLTPVGYEEIAKA